MDEVRAGAREAAGRSLRDEGAAAVVRDVELVEALHAHEGLRDAAIRLGAEALVIGRAAPRTGHHLVRLGRVARRLLRIATTPVIVVPPDLRAPDLAGDGPVVALTDLSDGSAGTCRFAEDMARRLGRPLLLAHAVEVATQTVPGYVSQATLERIAADRRAEAERALANWVEGSGVRADGTEILLGGVVEEATALAERRQAALVVAGSSRHQGTLEGLLVASTGSALAASATRPVAIVPPAQG
jgi:nucleotide-binding universal stress UspA family protein